MGANKVGAYEIDPMRSPYRIVGRHDSNPYASKNLRMLTMDNKGHHSALDGYNSSAAAENVNRRNNSTLDNRNHYQSIDAQPN